MEKKKRYRIEWMHNYQWRMEWNEGLVFETKKEALEKLKEPEFSKLQVRIVELEVKKS